MAEERGSAFDKNPNVISKGLFTDTNEEFQPESTYRFALNAILTSSIGEKGALINEEGNSRCLDLNDNSAHVIGNCLLNDGRVVLFVYYDAYELYPEHGSIIIQGEDCTFEYLIRSECLDFLPTDIINCEFKIQSGCDIILYFTDRRSRYRSINISKLERYVLNGRELSSANDVIAGRFGWDCGLFNFDPDYNVPQINLELVQFGGRLRIGAYFIALRYLDASLNATNWTPTSNPIYVTYPVNETNPIYITGGILNPTNLDEGYYYTSKSIKLNITDLDTRYQYFQLAVLTYTQQTDSNDLTYVSRTYNINGYTSEVTINELTPFNGFILESSTNIVVPKEYIDIVRAHTQIDRRLIVGNLSNIVNDWSAFQKAANNIKTLYYTYDKIDSTNLNTCDTEVINQIEINGVQGLEFNRSEFLFEHKTYMRDEIYAIAIVYVFKNGKESPAFHIPGRPAISTTNNTTLDGEYSVTSYNSGFETFNNSTGRARWYLDINDDWASGSGLNGYFDNYNSPFSGSWDREVYTYNNNKLKPYYQEASYNGFNADADVASTNPAIYTMANTLIDKSQNILDNSFCSGNTEVERWEFINTAIKFNTKNIDDAFDPTFTWFNELQSLTGNRLYSAGLCGYYETDSTYPKVTDCDGNPIFPYTIINNEIVMHKIRHHKMPDARHELLYEGLGTDEANTLISLKPLGLFFYNIELPVGYENDIQGFYIVRGDRKGNKTIIDKGWLNVCDVTFGMQRNTSGTGFTTVALNGELLEGTAFELPFTVQQNPIWMSPTDKYGSWEPNRTISNMADLNGRKQMHTTGANVVEFFSPKTSYNEPVNLQASYYKLENTIITTKPKEVYINVNFSNSSFDGPALTDNDWTNADVCLKPNAWEGNYNWKVFGFVEAYTLKLPRMISYKDSKSFYLLHNLPIQYSEYTLYNQDNIASNGYTLNNENHRQTIMLSRLYNDMLGISANNPFALNIASIFKPLAYFRGDENTPIGVGEFSDIINPWAEINTPVVSNSKTIDVEYLARNHNNGSYDTDVNAFNTNSAVHMYYVAIKSKIKPYQKLEDIIYIKSTNNLHFFPSVGEAAVFNDSGDCFISKQRLFKSFQRGTTDNVEDNSGTNGKLAGTVVMGYVESEINSHFRYKFNDDTYYANPFDNWFDCLQKAVFDVHQSETTLVDFIEHLYRYNLDYSADNRNRIYPALADVFDYCSECSEKFPITIRYSEPSISTQTADYYKIFRANSIQEIPADSGEITNLFVKEQNLFVHTVSNIYRLNLAPQSLQTSNDQIQVGSGTLATAVPQRMFDNANGYGRGGTEFEHSGVFCNDEYIWVDNKSKRVFSLSKGVEEISMKGLSMWFRNNLNLSLREQWKSFTGKDYPYLNTSARKSVGFIAGFDPYFDRYILHKKDYELSEQILSNIKSIPLDNIYIPLNYYHDDTTIYQAVNITTLRELNFENDEEIINKSFTISYSLEAKSWASFHSYRPNHIWNDNYTFFTSINNLSYSDYAWKHNVRNFQNYYDNKFDFIYDYVAKGEEPVMTKAFETIEVTGNVYNYNNDNKQWREVFFSSFDRLHVYNNNQSSGLFNIVVKNQQPYYDTYNNHVSSRTISAKRYLDTWKISNLRDYTADASITGNETINSIKWTLPEYNSYFTTKENMGYIDYAINPFYINTSKDVYQLQRFRDKFLNVRLFYKPAEDYKIVINTMANLKRTLV